MRMMRRLRTQVHWRPRVVCLVRRSASLLPHSLSRDAKRVSLRAHAACVRI